MTEKSKKEKLELAKQKIRRYIGHLQSHIETMKELIKEFEKQEKNIENELKGYTDTHDCFPL